MISDMSRLTILPHFRYFLLGFVIIHIAVPPYFLTPRYS